VGIEQGVDKSELADIIVHKRYNDLPSDDTTCDTGHVEKILLTAKLTGVQGVPFTIADNGSYMPGYIANLGEWLAKVDAEDQVKSLPNEPIEGAK
jgi:hypothetical protein